MSSSSSSSSVVDAIKSFFGRLWDALPSGEVALFYGGISACAAFVGILLYYAFVRRNPLNIDTFVKNNNYVAITKQTVAVFCATAVIAAAYYAIYKPMQTQPQIQNQPSAASSAYDPAFKLTIFALFACFAYVLYQMYSMLNWSITTTPRDIK